ncbi:MAG: Altered inheritance of mitochondria protein 24, mitochondrial [Sclerophora amabilis]|nr:MAG: Altered inheritance of mitochondria protein 24, mitochondrial [Sclerophora amabilis]
MTRNPPLPYRIKSSSLRLQIPSLEISKYLPDTQFFKVMWESGTWKTIRSFAFAVRTWSRRTIWGDRLFLRFQGPSTILLQSRASRLSDVFTTRDVNEVADAQPGVAQSAVILQDQKGADEKTIAEQSVGRISKTASKLTYASVGEDRKVAFQGQHDNKESPNR